MATSLKLDAFEADIRKDAQHSSQRQLAAKYNVSRDTMQRFLKAKDIETVPVIGLAAQLPDGDVSESEVMAAELRDLKSRVRRARTVDVQAERVLEEVRAAVQATPIRFEPLPPVLDTTHKPHQQVLMLSDLHAGEVVRPEAIDGLNEFHWDVLVERMQKIQRSVVSYKATRSYPIEEFHMWWLGDMCSGANHQEIAETNEFPQAVQAKLIGELLAQFIERLVPHYPKIVVYGVAGNHPRTTKAPAAKQVFDNWDWMAYIFVEVFLRQYIEAGTVKCHFPQSGFVVAEVAGLNILLWHGDGVRSTMVGFPGGGVMRRTRELKAQWAQKGVVLSGVACGHFHSAHVLPGNVFVNGSVKGPDEWCLKQYGYGDQPEQLLLTFDPRKHRRTEVASINP